MTETLPEQFGRYRILSQLGRGGMGAVYLAEDSRLGRQVAIKVPHFGVQARPGVIERFYREARLAGLVVHPNLCPIHDVDCQDGIHYLAMAYIEGTPLSQLIGPGRPWPLDEAIRLVLQLASVLQALHDRGIVHRDLKPSNVMVRADGTAVLMDFGLARYQEDADHLTAVGQLIGTPAYMAPEMARADGTVLGPPTDVYALGVVLYQMLTGQLPFQGSTLTEWLAQVLFSEPPALSSLRPDLDPRLDELFRQVLAKEPAARPASMTALAQLLRPFAGPILCQEPSTLFTNGHRPAGPAASDTHSLPTVTPTFVPVSGVSFITKVTPPKSKSRLLSCSATISISVCLVLMVFGGVFLSYKLSLPSTTDATEVAVGPTTAATGPTGPAPPTPPGGLPRSDFDLKVTMEGTREGPGGVKLLKEDDEIRFSITVDRDAYVGIFGVNADGSIVQLFPNEREPENLLKSGVIRRVPSNDKYYIRATPASKPEWIYTVASTSPLPPQKGEMMEEFFVLRQRLTEEPTLAAVRGAVVIDSRATGVAENVVVYQVEAKEPSPK